MSKFLGLVAATALATVTAGAAQATNFYASTSGDVVAYFVGSTASYDERLGLLINGVDTGLLGLQNHSSVYGDQLNFGHADLGDELTFYILVDTTGDTFYTDVTLNADAFEHIKFEAFPGFGSVPAGTLVQFEDIYGGGDQNFHDEVFVFTNLTDIKPDVPEPATWAMMVGGFGLVGSAMRRKRTAVSFG
ncbi:MAG TPA: PEPxxWA-CTERM sorting domain-containing protein [Sphingomonas sp.]|nr:PEPxxWA-CTERM sorting domain-containing protein [Sphingomonas sp.]